MADFNVTVGVDVDESGLQDLQSKIQALNTSEVYINANMGAVRSEYKAIRNEMASRGIDVPINLKNPTVNELQNWQKTASKIVSITADAVSKGFSVKTLFGSGEMDINSMEQKLNRAAKLQSTYQKYLGRFNIDSSQVDWSAGIEAGVKQSTQLLKQYGQQAGVVFDEISDDLIKFHEKFDSNTDMFKTFTASGQESFDGLRGSIEKFTSAGSDALNNFMSKLHKDESTPLFDALNQAIKQTGKSLTDLGGWDNIIKNVVYTVNEYGDVTSAHLKGVADNIKINVNMLRDAETGLLKVVNSTQHVSLETEESINTAKLQELSDLYKKQIQLKKDLANVKNEDSAQSIQQEITANQQLINSVRSQITDQERLTEVTKEYSDALQRQTDASAYAKREEELKSLTNAMNEMVQLQNKIAGMTGKDDFNTNQIEVYRQRIEELTRQFPQLANAYDSATNTLNTANIVNPFQQGTEAAKKFEQAIKEIQTTSNTVNAKQQDTKFKQAYDEATAALKKYIAAQKELQQAQSSGKASTSYLQALQNQLDKTKEKADQAEQKLKELNNTAGNTKFDNFKTDALERLNVDLEHIKSGVKQTGDAAKNMGNGFNSALSHAMRFASILGIFDGLKNAIYSAKNEIVKLNTAMTELQIVTESSDAAMEKTMSGYAQMAKELGVELKTVAEGAGEWLNCLGHYKFF